METEPRSENGRFTTNIESSLTREQVAFAESLLKDPSPRFPTQHAARRDVARPFEQVAAAVALGVSAPVLALAALLIRCESRGPVLFRQRRIGRDGCPFTIVKLRTMRVEDARSNWELTEVNVHAQRGDARMWKAVRDPRVTRTGALVRALGIDELPQMWNVVRGEMALVGPRPLTDDEDRWVSGVSRQRRAVAPGITGLWQVIGGNEISMEGMLWLDCAYVDQRSMIVDLRLLAHTPRALARGLRDWRDGSTG